MSLSSIILLGVIFAAMVLINIAAKRSWVSLVHVEHNLILWIIAIVLAVKL